MTAVDAMGVPIQGRISRIETKKAWIYHESALEIMAAFSPAQQYEHHPPPLATSPDVMKGGKSKTNEHVLKRFFAES
jgi:hypothetical protein